VFIGPYKNDVSKAVMLKSAATVNVRWLCYHYIIFLKRNVKRNLYVVCCLLFNDAVIIDTIDGRTINEYGAVGEMITVRRN
jgi:hypothetical protein